MRKLLVVIGLIIPLMFSAAQESDIAEHVTEAADAVASASWIQPLLAEDLITGPLEELDFIHRLGIAFAIIAGQALLIWLIWFLFKRLNKRLESAGKEKIKPFFIHKFRLLTAKQVVKVIEVFLRLLKYLITAVQLFLTIPIVFSLFTATKNLASVLFGYILNPVRDIAFGAVGFIPNLFKIIIIVIIMRYILKGIKFFANQIEMGKLKIPHFYTEWAAPTYRILQVLLWAFTFALVYPYLPGSDSRAFQGVSVFIGIIFSIGSTSAIGNLVAGLVITYMRPFKIGDRVKINELTGFIVEKNLMVVRLKTHKNEYVTFPNLVILNSSTVNYNTSSDEDEEGLIIFAEVTFGYSTPWQTVHDILISAALSTEHVQKRPKPFVLQTKLDDFYACYQINCYTKDVEKIPKIYTLLYENIQSRFAEAGLDMTSAHYRVITKN
ncbi:MAG: mechanosensitive ion channel family protein [Treponema sp.]|nr:mechanosensitive ion channel family protein [Treponema sp.]